jgi:peptide/nickel transport system substrate-binding protein/oligopeptide transport system substrate-binding protein
MEKNDNLDSKIRQLRGISDYIYSALKDISDIQIEYADELEKVRSKFQNINSTILVINKASNSLSSSIRKNEELLSLGISLTNEILKKTDTFLLIINTLSDKLNTLIGKRNEINSIVENLLSLNQKSMNTARNAEIKAYQAGTKGKGFEVVANELGKLTGESLKTVDKMVKSLEKLRDESKKIVDRFKNLQDNLSQFEGITDELKESINDLKGKFSEIINITDRLLVLLDNINTKREDIDIVANTMLSLSKNFVLTSGKINLILAEKESVGEVVEHLNLIYQYLKENNSPLISENIPQMEFALNAINRLNRISHNNVRSMKLERSFNEADFKELKSIRNVLDESIEEMKGVKGIIQSTLYRSKQGIENIGKVRKYIEQEILEMEEVSILKENLSLDSNELGRLVSMIDNLSDKARVISLYGKIEGSRIYEELVGLDSIVKEMEELSIDYSKIAEELEGFFSPVKIEIKELDKMIDKLNGIIKRLKEMVIESEESFKGTEEQTTYLTEISNSIKISLDKQKDIIMDLSDSFKKIINSINENSKLLIELEERIENESEFVEDILRNNIKEIKLVNILDKKNDSELRVYLQGDPLSLNPANIGDAPSNKLAYNIHRGLFDFSFSGGVYPLMVSKWELSPNALEWNFTVRDDVINHKGKKINAEDIKYSIERLKGTPNNFILDPIDSILITGKDSVTIKLKDLFMPLISNLATIGGSIISKDDGDNNDKPPGIGPFKLIEFSKNGDIILEAYSDYNFGKPYTQRLVFKKSENAIRAFKEDLVDIAPVRADEVSKIKNDNEIKDKLVTSEFLNTYYMGFNFSREDLPFNDRRVRQSLNYAVNNDELIRETESGLGTISRGIFPPGLSVYDSSLKGYGFNPHMSKELLGEAGYSDGLPDVYKLTISNSPIIIKRAEYLQKAFSDIGVSIEIDEYPWGQFLKKVQNGDSELFLLGWSADTADPHNFLFPLFHSSSRGIGGNTLFYSNKIVDTLIEEGLKEINPTKRAKIYSKLENILVEDAPMVFLLHSANFTLVKKRVFGFNCDPLNHTHYEWLGVQ